MNESVGGKAWPWFVLLVLAGILAVDYFVTRAPMGYDVAIAGAPYVVGGREVVSVMTEAIVQDEAARVSAPHDPPAPAKKSKVDETTLTSPPLETITKDGAVETRVRFPAEG